MGTTTYMDGKSESESLMDGGNNGNSSRGSIVLDDENNGKGGDLAKSRKSRNSKKIKRPKRKCMDNISQMMCN